MILVVMLTWVSELPYLSDARSRPGLGATQVVFQDPEGIRGLRVQNAVSERPMAARRHFRDRHHGA
jgi:hypothetical protein